MSRRRVRFHGSCLIGLLVLSASGYSTAAAPEAGDLPDSGAVPVDSLRVGRILIQPGDVFTQAEADRG